MSRERGLILYCLVVGTLGWIWLLASGPIAATAASIALFVILALLVESTGFRVPPSDPYSLVVVVLITAALSLDVGSAALVAALSGLLFGIIEPLIYGRPKTFYTMAARPLLRSGVRAMAILVGAAVANGISGGTPTLAELFFCTAITYPLLIESSRALREYLQGGLTGMNIWWRSAWSAALLAEVVPLPAAWLGALIYQRLPFSTFLIGCFLLLAASLTVRQASLNLRQQRRSVRELAMLNQASRAIIRAEMDVAELCNLIYREASKVVDTASFHLGLFAPEGDQYTLMVRVQDRVRLPSITMNVPNGDGIIGWMRETGRALLVEDFAEEMQRLPARPRYQSDRPPRSGIYVPLIDGDTVIGSISIQSYRPRAFGAEDMRLLSLIADQAAVAIAKARAFDKAQQRAIQLTAIHEVSGQITAILDLDELLQSIVRLIRERLGYHPVHIFTLEPDGRLDFRASSVEDNPALHRLNLHAGQGLVGTAALGTPQLVNDVRQDRRYISDEAGTRAEMAVPLRYGDSTIGVLDVQSVTPGRFSDTDLFVMETLAGQIATAIESARAFTAQREEAWTLNALLQVAEHLANASSLTDLLPTVVRLPPLLLGCDRCYCLEWDARTATFIVLAAYGLSDALSTQMVSRRVQADQAPRLAAICRHPATTILRPGDDPLPFVEQAHSGSMVVLPLTARAATLGLLLADYDDPQMNFTPRMLTLYSGIASQVAGALESALLAIDAAATAHLEEELRVAREIQRTLLPSKAPRFPGWSIAADWRSARLVGGDFYDFWSLRPARIGEGERLGFVIADVSDKGVPAALFMTLSRSLMRAAALDGSPPGAAIERANRWISRDSDSTMFVTLFYGILDPSTGKLTYSCAGHNPPLLIRATDGTAEPLSTPGIALGVLEDILPLDAETVLEPGDVLICYTDGVTEAIDGVDEEFGVPRLSAAAANARTHSSDEILRAIDTSLSTFTGERPPFDDVTLVIIKREA